MQPLEPLVHGMDCKDAIVKVAETEFAEVGEEVDVMPYTWVALNARDPQPTECGAAVQVSRAQDHVGSLD
jgi:hypothetical protein